MNEFLKRTLSAVVLAACVVAGVLYLPVVVLKLIISLLSVIAVYEVSNLLEEKLIGFKNIWIMVVSFITSISVLFLDFYLAMFIITLYSFWIGHKHWRLSYTSASFLTLIYGAVLLPSIGFLADIDKTLILLLFSTVWAGDTFAYFVGKKFGKHKMAPALSPKKTWEGAVAGFVASVVFGIVFIHYLNIPVYYVAAVIISAVMLQVGDLFESFIKRQTGKKDASNLIPGHGGLIDRIDSLIFASVVFVSWHNIWTKLAL